MMYGSLGSGGVLLMLLWLVLLVVIVTGLAWLVVSFLGGADRSGHDEAAETLRTRFAKGEISAEEYEQARRVLDIK